jgi:hypothetical protein
MPRKTSTSDSNAGKMEPKSTIPCQIGYGKYIYVYLFTITALSALDESVNQSTFHVPYLSVTGSGNVKLSRDIT